MIQTRYLGLIGVVVTAAALASLASAQAPKGGQPPSGRPAAPSAPASKGGDQNNADRQGAKYHLTMGRTYNRIAGVHARALSKYAAAGKQVPADVIKEHASAIGYNIAAAKRSFAKLGASAKDKGLDQQVAQVQARLDKVTQQLKQLEEQKAEQTESAKLLAQIAAVTAQLKANDAAAEQIDKDSYDSDAKNYYDGGGLGNPWGNDDAQETYG